jgi:Na+/H+ antiporter NhaD/arsenite permease-like protein
LHLEAATIVLFGAAALILYARVDIEEVLREVEWPTLLFFVGLFVLVGGLEVTGFIDKIGWRTSAGADRPSPRHER